MTVKPAQAALGMTDSQLAHAVARILSRCDRAASFTEEPGRITRRYLTEPVRGLHRELSCWMQTAGLTVSTDAVGNLIGRWRPRPVGTAESPPTLLIGSHLDTVVNAGRYDGLLGIMVGLEVAAAVSDWARSVPTLPAVGLEVLAFSEEEGVRFRSAYLGSRAVAGRFDRSLLERTDSEGITLAKAIRDFGLDPAGIPAAARDPRGLVGYLEVHIEQGPVLDDANLPVAVVSGIVGQTRMWVELHGRAGHAGTEPMARRRDALAGAAELTLAVERRAQATTELRATVGCLRVEPGAGNVIPGRARMSLDIRHPSDAVRLSAVTELLAEAAAIADRRGLSLHTDSREDHSAVPSDAALTERLARAAEVASGGPVPRMASGAGHDAAVMASLAPMAMLFVRSPDGVSHHPDEAVRPADVAVAVDTVCRFVGELLQTPLTPVSQP